MISQDGLTRTIRPCRGKWIGRVSVTLVLGPPPRGKQAYFFRGFHLPSTFRAPSEFSRTEFGAWSKRLLVTWNWGRSADKVADEDLLYSLRHRVNNQRWTEGRQRPWTAMMKPSASDARRLGPSDVSLCGVPSHPRVAEINTTLVSGELENGRIRLAHAIDLGNAPSIDVMNDAGRLHLCELGGRPVGDHCNLPALPSKRRQRGGDLGTQGLEVAGKARMEVLDKQVDIDRRAEMLVDDCEEFSAASEAVAVLLRKSANDVVVESMLGRECCHPTREGMVTINESVVEVADQKAHDGYVGRISSRRLRCPAKTAAC